MSDAIGEDRWVFPAGRIPLESTGVEPEFTSRDELCVLNTGNDPAQLTITVFFQTHDPVGPFSLEIAPRRVRHVPVNNLIDPQAIPLGVPYGLVVESTRPVVVQLSRTDTRRGDLAIAIAAGYTG